MRAPVVVAPHGVDHERFTPRRAGRRAGTAPCSRALGVPIDRPLVAFVGTLEPRKGVVPLIGAFDQVARTHPDAVLVLGGQTGWGMAETERALAAARHPERIVRTGYLPDAAVPALLRQAAVVAYPALEEGFGLPALEALACGAPLVTTEGTAMAEMAGAAALLVPPGDVAGLAAALGHGAPGGPGHGAPVARARRGGRADLGGERGAAPPCLRARPGGLAVGFPRMRALITGGKGFVGQWLAAHLKGHGRRGRRDRRRDGRGRRRRRPPGHGRRRARGHLPPGRHDPRR